MRWTLLLFILTAAGSPVVPARSREEHLFTLDEVRERVLLNNFEIAARKMGLESARRLFEGEKAAVWEPVLFLSYDRIHNERENNTEEFIRQGVEDFSEDNNLYSLGVEQPLVTGGSLTVSYNLDHLDNNLQEQRELDFEEREYDSFAGLSLVQPLLRNGGLDIGMQVVRMAREESEMAFQEYRRQLMQSVGQAEAAYWELRIAQERVGLREKSVEVARKVLEDNRVRVETGKMSELEVREAEAGLAERESQLLEARQSLDEASDRLLAFFDAPDEALEMPVRAAEEARLTPPPDVELSRLREAALELHPDVRIREHLIRQNEMRVDYARNQALPQLDLTASYGYNGLGEDESDAFEAVEEGNYPSWAVGVELRVPLGGGTRRRSELFAAETRLEQARLEQNSIRRQVLRALNVSLGRVRNFYRQAQNYQVVADRNRDILDTELTRLEAGRSDSRQVLEAEENLTRALESYAASLTRLAVANVELSLTSGTLLVERGVEPMELPAHLAGLVAEPAVETTP